MRLTSLFLFSLLWLGWCLTPASALAGGNPGSPVKLEPGKAILQQGEQLYFPAGTQIELGGKQLTTLTVTHLWFVPARQKKWTHEIRPVGSAYLQVKVAQDAFKGVSLLRPKVTFHREGENYPGSLPEHHAVTASAGATWLEQPYEIRDHTGKVVFTTPPPARPDPAQPQPPLPGEKERQLAIALHSRILPARLTLPESPQGVISISLTATVDSRGEGPATLLLDPNTLEFNEVGDVVRSTEIASVGLNCTLKFIKMGKVQAHGPPGLDRHADWPIYQIQGEKLTSRLFLVAPSKELQYARLLIQDRAGKVTHVIPLHAPPPPRLDPCHPGCFPAGTQILTPAGTRPIDSLRVGEEVTTVRPDGSTMRGKVQSVFITRNQLVRVETEDGILITTPTQPLCLENGEVRATEDLQPGDRIFRWHQGKRQAVKVRRVVTTDRQEKVFNLVLGNSEIFVAGGFLARSKPPVVAVESAPSRSVSATPAPATKK